MADRAVVRASALAKINLSLRVLGPRPDGYHELRTVFQSIALRDTLTISRTRGPFEITCSDPACPTDSRNRVWRAAERIWREAGRRGELRGASVRIVKRIPIQAGLGGGSSNAAAALRAFAALWRLPVSLRELRGIAAGLGADVPFFLEGGTCLGLERGDLLFPLVDEPRSWVVLVLPRFRVSTKEAFAWWDEMTQSSSRTTAVGGMNDLEAPVAVHHPEIGAVLRRLRQHGARQTSMSGSGSAVFGLFDSRTAAERAGAVCRRAIGSPDDAARVIVTSTVNRTRYQVLAAPHLPRS